MVWSDESDYESDNSYSDGYESDDYDPDGVDERPTTVPTLEKIATVKVAIALWNRATVVIPGIITHNKTWQVSLLHEVSKWIDALPIPKLFANLIKEHVKRVKYNVINWVYHLSRAVFFETRKISKLYQHVDRIIWYPNERINYLETARNLLKSDKLNNMQKFRLASAYCLQEEIEKMWPMLEKNDLGDEYNFYLRPLSCYWACFCNSRLSTIENRSFVPIDQFMIELRCIDNWSAIEYFFDRLNTEQQVTEAVYLIEEFGLRFQKLVLMKLNESQRLTVLMDRVIYIICNYAYSEDNEEDAIATWYEVRNLITRDQFVGLFSELLFDDTKDSILTEIWNTARDDFKQHILNYGNYDFIKEVLEWLTNYNESDLTFLSAVLSDRACEDIKREITKKPFFIKSCLRLCCKNSKSLDRLLNLCFFNAAASADFKKSLLESPYFNVRCKTLITNHRIRTLAKLLDFGFSITDPSSTQFLRKMLSENMKLLNDQCLTYYSTGNLKNLNDLLAPLVSSYPEIVSDYKKNLLLSDEGLRVCVSHFGSKKCILPKIITDSLPTDLAAEFKSKIIFSLEAVGKLKNMMVNKQLNAAKKLIDWYLESKRARKKLRNQLLMV
ncbi:uncharacterized protein LOC135843859 isoform X2 [Planococcus citri]|uniref:uncharacterized protein LOC135843859 isoform X2 n=1 Tax=Planococcus citri TaxID=170843 RepID=UPI0031F78289